MRLEKFLVRQSTIPNRASCEGEQGEDQTRANGQTVQRRAQRLVEIDRCCHEVTSHQRSLADEKRSPGKFSPSHGHIQHPSGTARCIEASCFGRSDFRSTARAQGASHSTPTTYASTRNEPVDRTWLTRRSSRRRASSAVTARRSASLPLASEITLTLYGLTYGGSLRRKYGNLSMDLSSGTSRYSGSLSPGFAAPAGQLEEAIRAHSRYDSLSGIRIRGAKQKASIDLRRVSPDNFSGYCVL